MADYREAFFSKLCINTQKASAVRNEFITIPFAATPEAFMDKYINPNLLEEIQTRRKRKKGTQSDLKSCSSLYHPELKKNEIIEDDAHNPFNFDYKNLHKNIPEPIVIRADQIVYHEEETSSIHTEFSVDDHNFREIIISQDVSDNPYATTNIQEILRNHHYCLNPDNPRDDATIELPPLKLPDLNVQISLFVERNVSSIEEEANARIYERDHPSLFAWDLLGITSKSTTESIDYLNTQSVDM